MDKTELGALRAIVLFNPGEWGAFIHYYSNKEFFLSEQHISCLDRKQIVFRSSTDSL